MPERRARSRNTSWPSSTSRSARKDGACATHVVTPEGEGPWPALILYKDACGIRPAFADMARHLAAGGHLATDEPHLLAPRLTAQVTIAAAENDGGHPPAMAARLEAAPSQAGVRSRAETYPAAHGWMMPDFPVHDPVAAERGWTAMFALFDGALHRSG